MIDLNELTSNELIKEGQFVQIKLRQGTIPASGVIKEIGESFIILDPMDSDEVKELQQQLGKMMGDHQLDYAILDRSDIKYIGVMKKVTNKQSSEEKN